MPLKSSLLRVEHLSVAFAQHEVQDLLVLDDISFQLDAGGILGLVGESGCGKSTLCRALLRTLRAPAYIAGGDVIWRDISLMQASPAALQSIRWQQIAMVVQSALDALNPVLRIETQLLDVLRAHGHHDASGNRRRVQDVINLVGLQTQHLKAYPHQLSGGMRQRVVIAMALVLRPQLLILDEPTTALDVVTQADILAQILELQQSLGFAILLITHDLPLALEFCHDIAVMYAGRMVEMSSSQALALGAQHHYAAGLLQAFPKPGDQRGVRRGVEGHAASFAALPSGCAFHPRCQAADGLCVQVSPPLLARGQGLVACHHPRTRAKSPRFELPLTQPAAEESSLRV